MFSPEQIEQLSAKLDKANVKERTQAGRKLSYVEGWHAIAEANRIFGFDAWTRETLDLRMVAERERQVGQGQGFGVTYIAKVRVIVDGVAREGIGAGHGIDRDLGLAHESAVKEAETDAMKRALMTFGNPFGLALYDKTQENVESAPAPGRTAPPSNDRTSNGGGAPSTGNDDALTKATMFAAKKCTGLDELRGWWGEQIPQLKRNMSPAGFDKLKTDIAALAESMASPFAEATE